MSAPLNLGNGTQLPFLELDKSHFENQTTVLYGGTKSGKTTFIKHIMFLLKDYIDIAVVISPSEVTNFSYKDYIPEQLIHTEIKKITNIKKGGLLQNIWDRQEALKVMAGKDVVNEVYEYIPKDKKVLYDVTIKKAQDIKDQHASNSKIKEKTDSIIYNNKKFAIQKHFDEILSSIPNNKKELKTAVHFLEAKLGILLIFDDCASEMEDICKDVRRS